MTTEQRGELPSGYLWKDLPGTRARFPMPGTWFFLTQQAGNTRAFFMTRESIAREKMYSTGLSVNIMPNIGRKTGRSAVDMAEGLMRTLPMRPLGEVTRTEDGPLVISRRFFLFPEPRTMPIPQLGGGVAMKVVPATNFYVETVGNRRTDTVYIVQFETPWDKWTEDRETAVTMIENGVLDPRI